MFLLYLKALEFSERLLIETVTSKMPNSRQSLLLRDWASSQSQVDHQVQLTTVLTAMCELGSEEMELVEGIHPYYHAAKYQSGEHIFMKNSQPDAFYIVLQGLVAVPEERKGNASHRILSGAGLVKGLDTIRSNFAEGHFHPAVYISEGIKKEKYKCFLYGKDKKYKKEMVFVPSFFPLVEGVDVSSGLLERRFDVSNFKIYILDENGSVYDFGVVKKLKK